MVYYSDNNIIWYVSRFMFPLVWIIQHKRRGYYLGRHVLSSFFLINIHLLIYNYPCVNEWLKFYVPGKGRHGCPQAAIIQSAINHTGAQYIHGGKFIFHKCISATIFFNYFCFRVAQNFWLGAYLSQVIEILIASDQLFWCISRLVQV